MFGNRDVFFRVFLLPEIKEGGLFLEHEKTVEHISQKADRYGDYCACKIVVDVHLLQKRYAGDVCQPAYHIHEYKLEYQTVVLGFEDQGTVSLEVEQNAYHVAEKGGVYVWVFKFQQIEETQEKLVDYISERCVQNGNQHETYELGVEETLQKFSHPASLLL